MRLYEQIEYMNKHFMLLTFADRAAAHVLLKRWRAVKRLDQMEQLKLDKLIAAINESKAKVQWANDSVVR